MAVLLGAINKTKNKIRISYLDSNGYKVYKYVTPLQLKILVPIIDFTIEN